MNWMGIWTGSLSHSSILFFLSCIVLIGFYALLSQYIGMRNISICNYNIKLVTRPIMAACSRRSYSIAIHMGWSAMNLWGGSDNCTRRYLSTHSILKIDSLYCEGRRIGSAAAFGPNRPPGILHRLHLHIEVRQEGPRWFSSAWNEEEKM